MEVVVIQLRFITGQLHQLYPDDPIFLLGSHQCPWVAFFVIITAHIVLWDILEIWRFREILLTSTIFLVTATTRVVPRVAWLWCDEATVLRWNVHRSASLS